MRNTHRCCPHDGRARGGGRDSVLHSLDFLAALMFSKNVCMSASINLFGSNGDTDISVPKRSPRWKG